MFETIVKLLILAVIAVLVFFIGAWVLGMLVAVAAIFGVAWLLNARFTVTENGEKVGYYKRTTGFVRTSK